MRLGSLVFRLDPGEMEDENSENDCFALRKSKPMVEQYAKFWSPRHDFSPRSILELGIWDGASIAFWAECFQPAKVVGIDIRQERPSRYFQEYIASRGLEDRIKTYWETDQADSERLRRIVADEFSGSLDLVIDDASHMYGPTKASFETLFPHLRPGGLYIIEDWGWGQWTGFYDKEPWAGTTALEQFIFELIAATGTWRGGQESPQPIANVSVFQGFAVIESGRIDSSEANEFKLEDHISVRRTMLDGLSGESMSHAVPSRKLIKALCFKLAAQPGFSWLRRFQGFGKKLLGG